MAPFPASPQVVWRPTQTRRPTALSFDTNLSVALGLLGLIRYTCLPTCLPCPALPGATLAAGCPA